MTCPYYTFRAARTVVGFTGNEKMPIRIASVPENFRAGLPDNDTGGPLPNVALPEVGRARGSLQAGLDGSTTVLSLPTSSKFKTLSFGFIPLLSGPIRKVLSQSLSNPSICPYTNRFC